MMGTAGLAGERTKEAKLERGHGTQMTGESDPSGCEPIYMQRQAGRNNETVSPAVVVVQ